LLIILYFVRVSANYIVSTFCRSHLSQIRVTWILSDWGPVNPACENLNRKWSAAISLSTSHHMSEKAEKILKSQDHVTGKDSGITKWVVIWFLEKY
jgi:hypothetical protein